MEIKAQDLDVSSPIDLNTPVKSLGGNYQLFYMMLSRLEVMSLTSNMQQIAKAVSDRDWDKMKLGVHSIKGASGYVGASRIHYACYFIQQAHQYGHHQEMLDRYPMLVESVIEFKRHSSRLLSTARGEPI